MKNLNRASPERMMDRARENESRGRKHKKHQITLITFVFLPLGNHKNGAPLYRLADLYVKSQIIDDSRRLAFIRFLC